MKQRSNETSSRRARRSPWQRLRRRIRPATAVALSTLLVVSGAVAIGTMPAYADDINATLAITKSTDDPVTPTGVVSPGESFEYDLLFSCGTSVPSVSGCKTATITDLLPEWIEFVSLSPFPVSAPGTSTVTEVGGRDQVTLEFTSPITTPGATTGLPLGTFQMTIQVKLADDAPWEINGTTIINTAEITAANADPQTDSAPIDAVVPVNLATTTDKSFVPNSNYNMAGQTTVLTLSGTNNTNGGVDTLTVQDPVGVAPLAVDDTNPFFYLEFTDFGAVTLPAGAEQVTAEVYSALDSTWHTVYVGAGPPVYPAAGPGIPDKSDIYGIRYTYTDTGGGRISVAATGTAEVSLTQRTTVESLSVATTIDNTVQSTVTLGGDSAVSPVVTKPYQIIPFGLQVSASKSFTPDQIKAGESTTVNLGAGNSGTATLSELTISEPGAGTPGSLSGDLTFAGFGTVSGGSGAGIQWPAGATGAAIVYHYEGGTSSAPLSTTVSDTIPTSPSALRVVGFDITFTGSPIASGAEAKTPFVVSTQRVGTPADLTSVANDVDVTGTAFADPTLTDSDTATDTVEIFGDRMAMEVSKSMQPSRSWLVPGQQTVAQIPATISSFPATTVNPTQVIVDDAAVLSPDWWNIYNATELPSLGIPSNATLTVQYTADGTSWTDLPGAVDLTSPPAYQTVTIDPTLSDTIVGLRFVYDAVSGESFDPGSTFQPNITFTTRQQTRNAPIVDIEDVPTNATIPDPSNPSATIDVVQVANCATADGSASTPPLTATTATTSPCPISTLVPINGGGSGIGPDLVDKDVTPVTVVERSQAGTNGTLGWSTGGLTGVAQMRVTETGSTAYAPATSANLDTSFLNSFDVIRLAPITKTTDPLIAYDTLVSVELFDYTAAGGAGAWVQIAGAPWDGPTSGNIVFPGYTLTDAERATTTGVRYTFEESPNRAAALTPGNLTQPAVGSGVAASTDRRPITVNFELRDDRRSDGTPVLYGEAYNTAGDPSVVTNTVNAQACLVAFVGDACADGYSTNDSDTITILNGTANITTTKSWSTGVSGGGALGIPPTGTPAADYPTTRMTLNVVNNGPQKVDTLDLEDPAPNVAFDGSAWDVFTLTNIVSIDAPQDTDAASGKADVAVYLDLDGGGVLGPLTIAAATALTPADLENVVGVRASATGRISYTSGGNNNGRLQIQLDAQLRETLRSNPATLVTSGSVNNTIFGSIGDPSVETSGSCSVSSPPVSPDPNTVISCNNASIALSDTQDRTVLAGKSFSPTSEYENTNDRIRMLLSGQPGGNARSNQLVLTDTTPGFWNAYGFAGLVNANPNQFAFPSVSPNTLAYRVQIELLTGATYTVESDNSITVTGGTWNTVVTGSGNQWMTAAQARTALAPGSTSATASVLGGGTVTYGAVQGIRLTYQKVASASVSDPAAALLLFENPANPTFTGNLFVQRRGELLTGGAVPTDLSGNTASPGTTSAGVYPNTVVADATGIPGNGSPATDDAAANFTFRHLPTSANLVKTPTGQVAPGTDFEVSLTTTNNGSYPIINPVITDNLPVGGVTAGLPDYVFPAGVDPTDPANYTFALSSGTSPGSPWTDLPVDPADITVVVTYSSGLDPEPVAIRFEFPTDSALGLGQVYRISWDMRLRSGAVANQPFVNQYEIDGDRDFDSCNGVAGTTNTCSTTAQVTTQPLATFGMSQQVRALDPALGVISSDGSTCTMADADADGFFVDPCVPVTKPGQNNQWRLKYENWGSYPLDQVSTIIYLPNPGLSGIDIPSAESLWRPILASVAGPGLRAVDTPTATRTVYYSTESPGTSLCDNVLNNGGTCPPGYWQPLTVGVDLTTVTALYVVVDFAGDLLQPGEMFQLEFETTAPPAAFNPGTDPITWNSAKTGGKYTTGGTQRTLPPFEVPVVGASLASGSLQVSKTVDGSAAGAGWVPTSFDGALSCISAGQPVPTSAIPAVPTLTAGSTVTVGGLPWGAECSFVETNAGSDVTLTPSTVTVTDDPASIELQSVTNTYEYASLMVEKTVEVPTPPGTTYPVPTGFEFTAVCTYLGATVLTETFTLDDGESRLFEELPARSECVVTETDPRDAESTVTSVTVIDPTVPPTTDQPARQATIPELSPDAAGGDTQNTVAYVNSYDLVALTITKDLEGEGAPQFGQNQTFTVGVVCTFAGETLVNTSVDLSAGNAWTASLTGLIAGSECVITEPDLEGADAVVITPNDGTDTTTGVVTLPDTGTATVTVTNWFLTGSLEVTKVFDGAAATQYGTADFDLELVCLRDGDEVDIPGGNDRTVNVTAPTASWTHLPTGADCTLAETDTGGAGATAILDAGGSVLVDPATSGYTFTVVTDPTILSATDQPQPSLQVRNTFAYAEVSVSKHVQTEAVDDNGDPIPFGPFEVTLQCTFLSASVNANEPMTQTIADGDTVTWTGLPEGADCIIDETDTAGAASTTYTITQGGATAPAVDGVSATLDPLPAESAPDQTGVLFTNDYPVDPLIIRKIVDGTGAGDVTRSFPVHVLCVLVDPSHPAPGMVVRDVNVEVGGPSNLAPEIDLLPLGSSCTITETDTGGASSVSITGTPYMGRPGAGGVPGTSTTVQDSSITVTLTDDHYLVEITNTFIKPLPATGGIFAWTVPIGAALITVIGLMFVLWRRFEPGRD